MTESVFSLIRVGDRVTIVTPHGSRISGRVVMKFATHAVLNTGGRHGTPEIATAANIVAVKPTKKPGSNRLAGYGG